MDRRMDRERRMDRQAIDDSIYSASIASRGKKHANEPEWSPRDIVNYKQGTNDLYQIICYS